MWVNFSQDCSSPGGRWSLADSIPWAPGPRSALLATGARKGRAPRSRQAAAGDLSQGVSCDGLQSHRSPLRWAGWRRRSLGVDWPSRGGGGLDVDSGAVQPGLARGPHSSLLEIAWHRTGEAREWPAAAAPAQPCSPSAGSSGSRSSGASSGFTETALRLPSNSCALFLDVTDMQCSNTVKLTVENGCGK